MTSSMTLTQAEHCLQHPRPFGRKDEKTNFHQMLTTTNLELFGADFVKNQHSKVSNTVKKLTQ